MDSGELDDDDWPKLTGAVNALNQANLFVNDQAGMTMPRIRSIAHQCPRREEMPAELSGEHFKEWFTQGVLSHRIIMNDTKALAHTVEDTIFLVTPGVFHRYGQEHRHLARIAKKANTTGSGFRNVLKK
nr:DNA-binding domain-containing protein [Pseudomonas sp. RGB]